VESYKWYFGCGPDGPLVVLYSGEGPVPDGPLVVLYSDSQLGLAIASFGLGLLQGLNQLAQPRWVVGVRFIARAHELGLGLKLDL
jgi:hypothetical protein